MVGKKRLSFLVSVLVIFTFLLTGCSSAQAKASSKRKVYKIGISQIVEHSALDAARKGFIDALASKGFKDKDNIEIEFQNAQGDMPTAQTIAQNFVSQRKDLILAIATQSAQAAYNATKDIPILITAVTDPVSAGVIKSLDQPGTNVTGTSDAAPIDKQMELLKKLAPNAKKIGIIYNTSEANSEVQVDAAKRIAPEFGLEIVTAGVTTTNDVAQTLDSLLQKVDALYLPTDNTVVSSMPIVAAKTLAKKIPVIGAEGCQVDAGALATEGIDYYKLGFQTGLVAVDVLNGKNPKDIPVTTLKDTELEINTDTAQKLGIEIPQDLMARAKLVKGGGK